MKLPKKSLAIGACVVAALSACSVAYSLQHPNFQSADVALANAISHIRAAQDYNGPTFGGHAARAIELAQQAREELSIADGYRR